MVETDKLVGKDRIADPILALFSRVFLRDRHGIIEKLTDAGHAGILHYVLQQIRQFHEAGEGFAMQHTGTEEMNATFVDLLKEEYLDAIPPEDRLRGLSPDEIVQALPPETREALRRLLENGESELGN